MMSSWEIVNADCFDVLPETIERVSNPVIVTDPPFNIGYHYNEYRDKLPESEYWAMLGRIANMGAPSVFVHYPEGINRLSIEIGRAPVRVLAWVYPSNTARQHRDIAFYGVKPDFRRVRQPYRNQNDKRVRELQKRTGGGRLYDWIECNQVKNVSKEKTVHPCQMPLELMQKVVGILPDGITVIDPFAGSGTTTLACALAGIPSVGIEVNELYAQVAYERIEATTGVGVEYVEKSAMAHAERLRGEGEC